MLENLFENFTNIEQIVEICIEIAKGISVEKK